jgi:glucokinase
VRETYLRLGGREEDAADTRAVFALAGAGETTAIRAIKLGASAAGQAVGGLANVLDPEVVVVTGGLADAGEPWWQPMEHALRAELLPALGGIPVLHAKLGNAAAMVGAGRLILGPAPHGS